MNKLILKVLFHSKDVGHWYNVIVQLISIQCVSNNKIVIALQNCLRMKKIVRIIYFPIIFPDKVDNIKIN